MAPAPQFPCTLFRSDISAFRAAFLIRVVTRGGTVSRPRITVKNASFMPWRALSFPRYRVSANEVLLKVNIERNCIIYFKKLVCKKVRIITKGFTWCTWDTRKFDRVLPND
ncbi:PREDICTED: uncharacterized protein LOC108552651 [Eufriesea mexicana]|uniref:uncharacterized protein LOC108552651 n=1 Tax=Eufriesea mexicana TaxID=516756 RepID=UPI00083BC267|nr:PREDICTED: uncharacterized protein LOC108552651 [Eufriesea mexicana]